MNYNKRILLLPFLAIVITFSGPALRAQEALSLQDALTKGLENNFQIRISRLQENIAGRNNHIGAAGFLPQLGLTGRQGNVYNDPNNPASFLNFPNSNVSFEGALELNWVLFDGFRAYITKSKLALLEEQSAGNTAIIVENTLQAIILAYYNSLIEKEKLATYRQVLQLSKDRYQYEEERKAIGVSSGFQSLQFKTAFLSDSTNLLIQELAYDNALTELKLLMAAEEGSEFELTDTLNYELQEPDIDTLRQSMLSNNATLRNQFINTEIFKKDIGLQQANFYPTIGMNAGTSKSWNTFKSYGDDARIPSSNGRSSSYYVNFSLNFTLFNGGNFHRSLQNSKIQEQIAQYSLEDAQLKLGHELTLAYDLFSKRKRIVDMANQNLESAALNLQLAEERFKTGNINSLDYRNIQRDYLDAALRRLEAINNAKDTETELLRLAGSLISEYQ